VVAIRSSALDMLSWFCSKTEADYTHHIDDLLRQMIALLSDSEHPKLVVKAWNCINAIINANKGSILMQRLPTIRQSIRLLTMQHKKQYSDDVNRPLIGFCLPKKGISCILPVFKECLLNGSPEVKEQASQTLCDCIKLSDGESLKSCVMTITGPLIRVLGERYSWTVKSAILDAIYNLLLKVGVTLRPFLPQLQPTFLKNLNDINRVVRIKSGFALAKLLPMNPKMDQIVNEIHGYITNSNDAQIKETLINTLRLCVNNVGDKLQEETKKQLLTTFKSDDYIYNDDVAVRSVSCGLFGSLMVHINNENDFESILTDLLGIKSF
jgi:hypothetical protein